MHPDPAALDREFEARRPGWRGLGTERLVDFLDAALNRLDRVGDFENSASGFFRVGIGAGAGQAHARFIAAGSRHQFDGRFMAQILVARCVNGCLLWCLSK